MNQTEFRITSTAFAQGAPIPDRHAYRKQNLSPPLEIAGLPANAKCLALIVDDPDAPVGTWVHWLLANIAPAIKSIPEGTTPPSAIRGKNDFGTLNWGGPAPPSGTHRYFFRIYALDAQLQLKEGFSRKDLDAAMKGHVLATAELMGTYAAR
ncbi:MAG TPA: YbhB/YbcL family Raf kinase inhibitor-like protein [Verrucomicrobiae bacterium]|nr:YbhB/YbcL family Raf kinase inhibitor-like protein [Verrucomicrobiae bacterium]